MLSREGIAEARKASQLITSLVSSLLPLVISLLPPLQAEEAVSALVRSRRRTRKGRAAAYTHIRLPSVTVSGITRLLETSCTTPQEQPLPGCRVEVQCIPYPVRDHSRACSWMGERGHARCAAVCWDGLPDVCRERSIAHSALTLSRVHASLSVWLCCEEWPFWALVVCPQCARRVQRRASAIVA